jgi:hypothetical protein
MTNEYPIWAEYLPHKKRYSQKHVERKKRRNKTETNTKKKYKEN